MLLVGTYFVEDESGMVVLKMECHINTILTPIVAI